jgi:hypothetical protein
MQMIAGAIWVLNIPRENGDGDIRLHCVSREVAIRYAEREGFTIPRDESPCGFVMFNPECGLFCHASEFTLWS